MRPRSESRTNAHKVRTLGAFRGLTQTIRPHGRRRGFLGCRLYSSTWRVIAPSGYQTRRAPIWTFRGFRTVAVTSPKLELVGVRFGAANPGRLSVLKVSNRI